MEGGFCFVFLIFFFKFLKKIPPVVQLSCRVGNLLVVKAGLLRVGKN